MGSALKVRSPAVLMTVIGVGATLVVTAAVLVVLLLFGSGAKAVSDNAALIGALVALGGVFTTQLVNSALEAQRAEQARKTEEAQRDQVRETLQAQRERDRETFQAQRERDREIEQAQRERELEVGNQRAQDDAAQVYLDQMAGLLLDEARPLRGSTEGDEVRILARARTLTVLSRLDGARKGDVVQFLYESDLITHEPPLVDLTGANLTSATLGGASLSGANLSGVNLREAYLGGVNLSEAYLSGVNLMEADLSWGNLSGTNLMGADLRGAILMDADMMGADLEGAILSGANLMGADLEGAILSEANLERADLSYAKGVTNEQLSAASSLEGATMPDGQKYEDWIKSRGVEGEDSGRSS
jgi:uncharacterized protein YjbI with pentapeptide repeats